MTTFSELLETPLFSDLNILTNHSVTELNITVNSIEITETPDVAFHIPENIVLLTTAMVYKDNQKGLMQLIDSLKEKKVVALGIKTGRFLKKIDSEVIDYANEIDFPIFDIPGGYSLGSLLHQLTNRLWDSQREEILFALDIQKRFSDLLFNDAQVEAIVTQLGKIIKAPALLFNPFYQSVAQTSDLSYLNISIDEIAKQLQIEQQKSNRQTGTFILENNLSALVTVVNANEYHPSYLVILYPESIPYPISQFAIDQAVLVISFALYKNEKIQESDDTVASNHLYELLSTLERKEEIDERWLESNQSQYFLYSKFYQMVQIHLKPLETNSQKYKGEILKLVGQWLSDHHKEAFENSLFFYNNQRDGFLLLLQLEPQNLKKTLRVMNSYIRNSLNVELMFSIGLPVDELKHLNRSYVQSKLAYEQRMKYHDDSLITVYENTGATQLFSQLDSNEVKYYCQSVLKDFAYPTERYLKDLRETLGVYLANQCEITSTAESLYIHRNTVKYRIERCEEILGRKISTPESTLNIRLALELSADE